MAYPTRVLASLVQAGTELGLDQLDRSCPGRVPLLAGVSVDEGQLDLPQSEHIIHVGGRFETMCCIHHVRRIDSIGIAYSCHFLLVQLPQELLTGRIVAELFHRSPSNDDARSGVCVRDVLSFIVHYSSCSGQSVLVQGRCLMPAEAQYFADGCWDHLVTIGRGSECHFGRGCCRSEHVVGKVFGQLDGQTNWRYKIVIVDFLAEPVCGECGWEQIKTLNSAQQSLL